MPHPDPARRNEASRRAVLTSTLELLQEVPYPRLSIEGIARRAGVPIVPIAVVGAEEAMPVFAKSTTVARRLGLPYLPLTVGYLPAKFVLRVLPPVRFDVEPGLARYSRSRIMDESEAIRTRIQDALHDMLRTRRSIWFG